VHLVGFIIGIHNDTLLVGNRMINYEGFFWWSSLLLIDHRQRISICPEAFAATEYSESFSGREPRQSVKVFLQSSYLPRPIIQGSTKPPATPWRWERIQFLTRQKTFASWHGCLPEKISRNEFRV
jgi:hypothetical protein